MNAARTDRPFMIPPTALRELLQRAAIGRRTRRRLFWRRAAKRMHIARMGDAETIESNLPIR